MNAMRPEKTETTETETVAAGLREHPESATRG